MTWRQFPDTPQSDGRPAKRICGVCQPEHTISEGSEPAVRTTCPKGAEILRLEAALRLERLKPTSAPTYDSYVVTDGRGRFLMLRTANGAMWNSSWKYATPLTKEKAEWWAEIVRLRAVEGAAHAPAAAVQSDYHKRKPEA